MNTVSNFVRDTEIRRGEIKTLQVNLGNLCNQRCLHCHIDASPDGKDIMSGLVIDDILGFLSNEKDLILDITGGAPELNPHFYYLVCSAQSFAREIIVRSNLTVFFEPGKEYLPNFFRENKVHLICSLPCYTKENVDSQRGQGAFEKSIKSLRILNELGFAKGNGLHLDLVHNPIRPGLPPQQDKLETEYKRILSKEYGISFNRLITITNAPLKRFKDHLKSRGEYDRYIHLLKSNFNTEVLENLMCRSLLSVGYDGRVYDCDFNQASGLALRDREGKTLTIDNIKMQDLEEKEIILDEHCLSCAAGSGSSCQGALTERGRNRPEIREVLQSTIDSWENVKAYYGKVLRSKQDLKTNTCCSTDYLPSQHKEILKEIDPEILNKFYGCGSPLPPALDNCVVLDLGCGTGRDVYLASRLVGQDGFVIGMDMTEKQLNVAHRHISSQMRRFGFSKPNVDFRKGYIEDLKGIGIEDNSIDVAISNCVINLTPDKREVFKEIFRVLKPGGELYFSDIFTGRRVPEHLKSDKVLYGECLAGALYIEDFRRILRSIGCLDYRVVSKRKITLNNPELKAKVGMVDFYAMTIRAFKLDTLEDICEDYGQIAIYSGTILPEYPHRFILDEGHIFITKKPMLVCGNTASMLQETRYAKHFQVMGDRSIHYGPFNCAPASVKIESEDYSTGGCCS